MLLQIVQKLVFGFAATAFVSTSAVALAQRAGGGGYARGGMSYMGGGVSSHSYSGYGRSGGYGSAYGNYNRPSISLSIGGGSPYGLGYGAGYGGFRYGQGYSGGGYRVGSGGYGYRSSSYPYIAAQGNYSPYRARASRYPQTYAQPALRGRTSSGQAGYGNYSHSGTANQRAVGSRVSPTSDLRPGMVLSDGSTVLSVGPIGGRASR
ncbi:hypothetical protein [Aureliella helgolandensis]|uniref:Uncharacterized protein n=1 Tax=Aureliella helgolandensis TaxID=2527968 RepID=A0A518G422_9BACT|nr:hypothetical protein [Aureliella helgolandensis]QDV23342.1 hypothetical protein Q31a_16400 [Aureliella helgolandensis]